jgi:hypothetical protein
MASNPCKCTVHWQASKWKRTNVVSHSSIEVNTRWPELLIEQWPRCTPRNQFRIWTSNQASATVHMWRHADC